jgi:putative SOS response-associated peptidase YedK
MCGRFVSASPPDEIAKYFNAERVPEQVLEPSFNVAPTTDIYAVMERGGERLLDVVHWGLVPMWAKDIKVGNRMINARADKLATSNAYKRAFTKRRCIIPVDGFFEWKKVPGRKAKQPYFIRRVDGEPFALAGLWEVWRGPDRSNEDILRSATIITGEPNEKVAAIHDRMPIMLPPSAWEAWLDPENNDLESLSKLLVPAPAELLELYPITLAVNNPRENGPEVIEPAGPDEIAPDATDATGEQGTLA